MFRQEGRVEPLPPAVPSATHQPGWDTAEVLQEGATQQRNLRWGPRRLFELARIKSQKSPAAEQVKLAAAHGAGAGGQCHKGAWAGGTAQVPGLGLSCQAQREGWIVRNQLLPLIK